ncbi:MAG: type II toxin-antitoxin system VapC family toxin [Anaerolineales bacterium]
MTQPLRTFTGETIYLDTMVPYALLRGIDPAVEAFFERLAQESLTAYTSALTFDELAYRFLLALIKDGYGGSPLDRLRKEEDKMMGEFAPAVAHGLRRLRAFPNLVTLDVAVSDLDAMNDAMLQYHLRPRDALHLAAMQRVDCLDLASNDAHFDRIPHIRRFEI